MSKISCHWKTLGVLSLALFCGQATAGVMYKDCCLKPACCVQPTGFYVGLFGGGGNATSTHASQRGTAFYSYDPTSPFPGPLAVDAEGDVSSNSTRFWGIQLGHAMKNPGWFFTPAVEVEGFYLHSTLEGDLDSPLTALPAHHTFSDSFHHKAGVFLVNSVFSFNTCWPQFHPYLGGGIGGAVLTVSGADSLQISPIEAGVNHFNSERTASDATFAAQIKAGLSYDLTCYCSLFAEYRFLYLGPSRFDFGSTVYPEIGHVPTAPWGVNVDSVHYNLGSVGIKFTA